MTQSCERAETAPVSFTTVLSEPRLGSGMRSCSETMHLKFSETEQKSIARASALRYLGWYAYRIRTVAVRTENSRQLTLRDFCTPGIMLVCFQTVSHCYSHAPSVTDPAFGCMSPMGKLRLHEVKQVVQRAAVPPEFTVRITLHPLQPADSCA